MKKNVTIVGIRHITGVSKKTDKAYDFYELHATYPDPDTEGFAVISLNCPDTEVPMLKLGEEVTIFTHFYNGKEYLDAILR